MNNLAHVSSMQQKKEETTIDAIASCILDIESIYHENFRNSLDNEIDLVSLKKCKTELSILLKKINVFNVFLKAKELNYAVNSEGFRTIQELPRIKINFKKRGVEFPFESQDKIDKENTFVEKSIVLINEILTKSAPVDIIDVRKKYISNEDGYLFTLELNKTINNLEVIEILESLNQEVSNLTLDELMISQQFTSLFKIEYINPFWLESQNKDLKLNQTILLSVRNIDCSSPFYYFKKVIEHLIAKIKKDIKQAQEIKKDNVKCFFSYNSINQSYIYCNLEFNLENVNVST